MTENKDKQAFPTENTNVDDNCKGLTKLEYITTMLMQGMLSNEYFTPPSMHPALNVPLAVEIAKEVLSKSNE